MRLAELQRLQILDTPAEPRFDRLTALVADVFDVPIVLVSFIDADRQWFKSACGFDGRSTPRALAFCAHAILEPDLLVVPDARLDARFAGHPLVAGPPQARFYAGAVLKSETGLPLGTLCLIDTRPRDFDARARGRLLQFARIVEAELHQDISDAQSRVRSQLSAHLDPLTGFFNQAEFAQRYRQLRTSLGVAPGAECGGKLLLVMVKLPQLGFLQRHYGLDVYQGVLGPVSQCLARTLRNTGVLFGRQERGTLVAALPWTGEDPEPLAQRLQQAMVADVQPPASIPALTVQIGVAPDATHLEESLYHCQIAIEDIADDTGINAHCFSDADRIRLKRSSQVALDLIDAMKLDQLALNFQPKVDVASGAVVGMEALLRWDHPGLGAVGPLEIVQAARESDLGPWLDNWVMEAALRQLAQWSQDGAQLRPVSVNLSGESLQDGHLLERVKGWLARYPVDPCYLQFEVLESAILTDLEAVLPVLQELVSMGITLALDDFGTEYSSLRYLQRLPVSTLKIDRSFVREIVENQEDAMLALGIISIAHDLGVTVVAEGVETREQYVILRSFKCDTIQGNVFSTPRTPAEIRTLLDDRFRFPDPLKR